jgi:Na+-driven multidrug efflux pump
LIIAGMLAAMSSFLPGLFSQNPAVTETARLFLLIAPLSYGAYGVVMVMNASFNGMGKPMPAVVISVARMAVLYVPLAILMQNLFGIVGIFGTYAFANIASAVVAYYWARNSVQTQCDKHESPILVSETG